jgi:hypothetical protein
MRTLYAGAAGALMLAFAAIPASAAPGIGSAASGTVSSNVIQARYNKPDLPLAFWIWRCADGHCGYWHRNEHRWQDGWHRGPSHVDRDHKWHRYSRR